MIGAGMLASKLAPWRLVIELVLIAAAAAGGAWAGYEWADAKRIAEVESIKAAHLKVVADHEKKAREASEQYRKKEDEWRQRDKESEAKHAAEINEMRARARAIAAATDGLRNDLRDAAAACGGTSEDPITACRQYAAALGDLLTEYREAGLQNGQAAETHAADVRRLLAAWPQ